MRRVFKFLLYSIGILVLFVAAAAAFFYFKGVPSYAFAPTAEIAGLKVTKDSVHIARGAKIAALMCNECHLGEKMKMTGKIMPDLPKEFGTVASYNITQDADHGIAKWSDGELYYFLRTGIRKDGSWAPPFMPKFPLMANEDLYSVIAWLRSDDPRLQATPDEYPPNQYNLLVKFLSNVAFSAPPLPDQVIEVPDTTDMVALGKYVANGMSVCFPCHSADFKKFDLLVPENTPGFYGGGNPMLNMEGEIVHSANITMDKETGLGKFSRQQFLEAVKYGKNPRGGSLVYPMFPHTTLTDQEVNAVYAYLQTVPVIHNPVDRYVRH